MFYNLNIINIYDIYCAAVYILRKLFFMLIAFKLWFLIRGLLFDQVDRD